MVIWQGWGILAVVLGFGGLVAAQALLNGLGGPGTYESDSSLWGGLGVVVGGIATAALGLRLNGKPPKVLLDEESGERVEVRSNHSLFWIKMEYWGAFLIVGGLAMVVGGLLD